MGRDGLRWEAADRAGSAGAAGGVGEGFGGGGVPVHHGGEVVEGHLGLHERGCHGDDFRGAGADGMDTEDLAQAGAGAAMVAGRGAAQFGTAAARGMQVVLVEMAERILQRVAARETSDYFRALHTRHGVDIREGVGLERLLGDGQVSGARLSDGTGLDVDMVIVGVGIVPDTTLAEAAGLETDNGIAVDAQGRTSDPAIWAVGDCASFPHQGGRLRLESVPNAIDMGECVAGNIMGHARAYVPQPWFWSDQYDVKLQIAGLSTGYDRIVTRDGGAAMSFWYYRGDQLLAVDAMNDPRAYMVGKRLIDAGKSADPDLVADAGADLKPLLKP